MVWNKIISLLMGSSNTTLTTLRIEYAVSNHTISIHMTSIRNASGPPLVKGALPYDLW